MRVLTSSVAAAGHLVAVLPLARAAADRGHEVAVAVAEAGADAVVQRDLPVFLLPPPTTASRRTVSRSSPGDDGAPRRRPRHR